MCQTLVEASQKLLPLLSAIKGLGLISFGADRTQLGQGGWFSRLGLLGPSCWAPTVLIQLQGAQCLGCCSCFKCCSHRTSWAGECSRSFPRHKNLCLSLPSQVLPPSFPPLMLHAPAILKYYIVLNLCSYFISSFWNAFTVLPSGKFLLILQNPAQISRPPGSSLASFPSEFITPLSLQDMPLFLRWSHSSSYNNELFGSRGCTSYLWI